MLNIIPFVAKETCFSLKGGTAINFFLRDMPRLSVDIDLAYTPIETRDDSLKHIAEALARIAEDIMRDPRRFSIKKKMHENRLTKMFISTADAQITIEPNEVIRGAVYPSIEMKTSRSVEDLFEQSTRITLLNTADIYGGKICAALDRQHPRDMFDMKILLDHEGITPEIRRAFVIYLAGHDRPMHELLDPVRKDVEDIYEKAFKGMTIVPVVYKTLVDVRESYIAAINKQLNDEERKFLISVKEGSPEWQILGIDNLDQLPAIQWKLRNIRLLKEKNPKKHQEQLNALKRCLKM